MQRSKAVGEMIEGRRYGVFYAVARANDGRRLSRYRAGRFSGLELLRGFRQARRYRRRGKLFAVIDDGRELLAIHCHDILRIEALGGKPKERRMESAE